MHTRKNTASLNDDEKRKFMNAVLALKKTIKPGHSTNIYDEFVAIHYSVISRIGLATGDGGHGGPAFLAWHREYILRFEKELQAVDPDVFLPYWKWESGNADDTDKVFTNDFLGEMGIQTSGYLSENPNSQNPDGWTVDPRLDQGNHGTTLVRNSSLNTSSLPASAVSDALNEDNFHDFRPDLESPHGTVHILVGGHMSRMTSPNDPIFFLHHANVDRIWAKWQLTHPGAANYNPNNVGRQGHRLDENMWPWDGGESDTTITSARPLLPSTDPSDTVTPRDVLDIEALDYVYDDVAGSSAWNTSSGNQNGNSRCFIATAAYGSELEPPVQFLREFRDNIILKSRFRNSFEKILDVYYSYSPSVANQMRRHKLFKHVMKYSVVWPFVALARLVAFLTKPFVKKF